MTSKPPKPPALPLTHVVPPSSHAIPHSTDHDDDKTPVQHIPPDSLSTIAHRTRATDSNTKEALSTISLLRYELKESVKRGEREDARLTTAIHNVDTRIDVVDGKVGELARAVARSEGKLDILVEDISTQKRIVEHREKFTIEVAATEKKAIIDRASTENKIALEDAADEKKVRRLRNIKMLAIIGGAVTTLTTVLTALISKCG